MLHHTRHWYKYFPRDYFVLVSDMKFWLPHISKNVRRRLHSAVRWAFLIKLRAVMKVYQRQFWNADFANAAMQPTRHRACGIVLTSSTAMVSDVFDTTAAADDTDRLYSHTPAVPSAIGAPTATATFHFGQPKELAEPDVMSLGHRKIIFYRQWRHHSVTMTKEISSDTCA